MLITRQEVLKVFFDGGSRPNPGPMEIAVVARGQTWFFDELGIGNSSDAEWAALCVAAEIAQSLGVPSYDLIGDSRGIINQAAGIVRSRSSSARAHLARYNAVTAASAPRRLRWIPREQNLAGIALTRRRNAGRHAGVN